MSPEVCSHMLWPFLLWSLLFVTCYYLTVERTKMLFGGGMGLVTAGHISVCPCINFKIICELNESFTLYTRLDRNIGTTSCLIKSGLCS